MGFINCREHICQTNTKTNKDNKYEVPSDHKQNKYSQMNRTCLRINTNTNTNENSIYGAPSDLNQHNYLRMKNCLFSIALFIFNLPVFSQNTGFHPDMKFINYLVGKGETKEALRALDYVPQTSPQLTDSIHFLKGWLHYQNKELEQSCNFLLKVSNKSENFMKSRFFSAYNKAYLGEVQSSDSIINDLNISDTMMLELKYFELSGNRLLDRDFEGFAKFNKQYQGAVYFLDGKKDNLERYEIQLKGYKRKSPGLSAIMSAAVPGLGKIYSGKTAEGVASFLYVGTMAGVSYELYRKDGLKSPFFWLAATATSVFYIGNIWGSYFAAQRTNNLFYYEIDQRILFDLHIPLRNFFN